MALCFATNNQHKLSEVKALLPGAYTILTLDDINCQVELPETQDTLEGNAFQKASFVKEHFGVDCFADDTGLEVDALMGAPGVHSARYAGPQKNDRDNRKKLLQVMKKEQRRTARFRTAVCLILKSKVKYFEGIVEGSITYEPKGAAGFGYDSIFVPRGRLTTFAEMTPWEKNQMSHRGKAIKQLANYLTSQSDAVS